MNAKEQKRRITARKSGGDDAESWAVFVDGREVFNGMNRGSVPYYKRLAVEMLDKREQGVS